MPMYKPLASLFCSHVWNEVASTDATAVKDTNITIQYRDVECQKCGKRQRMTAQEYIRHVVKTKRVVL
jgi:hypothetical protein